MGFRLRHSSQTGGYSRNELTEYGKNMALMMSQKMMIRKIRNNKMSNRLQINWGVHSDSLKLIGAVGLKLLYLSINLHGIVFSHLPTTSRSIYDVSACFGEVEFFLSLLGTFRNHTSLRRGLKMECKYAKNIRHISTHSCCSLASAYNYLFELAS